MPPHGPEGLADRLRPFAPCFTAAIWHHVLVLVAGTLLAPGRRTVAAALRVMGVDQTASFAVYHRVLSAARWSARAVARHLLLVLVATFVPGGPVVVGIDATIERRWGAKIKARGIYRDPVRSSHGHFVKASGLRWLCLMVLAPMPWGGIWGLPFLTVLAPSERYARARGRRHKKLTDWARQALLQTARWLPDRPVVAVADSSFSAIDLLRVLGRHLCVVTRLRLDAGLYEPAPARKPGTIGRPRVKGPRLPSLADRVKDPATPWRRVTLVGWYGGGERRLDIASGTAVWHHPGMQVAIRWVLVRDAEGEKEPQACAPTRGSIRSPSSVGACAAGAARRPSRRRVVISAWQPSGNGRIWPSCAPRPPCSASSRWLPPGRARSRPGAACHSMPLVGIRSARRPSATPSPPCARNSGAPKLSPPLGPTRRARKSPPASLSACCSSLAGLHERAKSS